MNVRIDSRIGTLCALLGCASLFSLAPARAQDQTAAPAQVNPIVDPSVDNTATNPAQPVQNDPTYASAAATPKLAAPAPRLREDVSIDGSYVAGSNASVNGGSKAGNLSEDLFKFGYTVSMPVNEALAIRLEAGYRQFDFGSLGTSAAIPQSLQTANLGLGASYRLDPKWQLFAELTPQLDSVDGWGSDSTIFRLSGAFGYVYAYRPNIIFTTGLAINPGGFSDFPIMPVGGVHWKITDKWTLDLGLPRTALDYALTDKLHLWTGGSFEGGTYKTGETYGNAFDRPDLNERKFSYREIRVGVGADYTLAEGLSLGGEIGSAVYREFDFNQDNDKVKADPALFAQLGLKYQF